MESEIDLVLRGLQLLIRKYELNYDMPSFVVIQGIIQGRTEFGMEYRQIL